MLNQHVATPLADPNGEVHCYLCPDQMFCSLVSEQTWVLPASIQSTPTQDQFKPHLLPEDFLSYPAHMIPSSGSS